MNARDELAKTVDEVRDDPDRRDMSRIIEREYSQARFEGFGEWDRARLVAHHLHTAGYRQIFDGDRGLSNVKDPSDREASEAWMRWANLVSGNGHDGIAAMKQMLTEFGYRKPRTITTAEELDALPDGSVLMSGNRYKQYAGAIWRLSGGTVERVGREQFGVTPFRYFIDPLPATVLHEPEAAS